MLFLLVIVIARNLACHQCSWKHLWCYALGIFEACFRWLHKKKLNSAGRCKSARHSQLPRCSTLRAVLNWDFTTSFRLHGYRCSELISWKRKHSLLMWHNVMNCWISCLSSFLDTIGYPYTCTCFWNISFISYIFLFPCSKMSTWGLVRPRVA